MQEVKTIREVYDIIKAIKPQSRENVEIVRLYGALVNLGFGATLIAPLKSNGDYPYNRGALCEIAIKAIALNLDHKTSKQPLTMSAKGAKDIDLTQCTDTTKQLLGATNNIEELDVKLATKKVGGAKIGNSSAKKVLLYIDKGFYIVDKNKLILEKSSDKVTRASYKNGKPLNKLNKMLGFEC